MQLGKCRIHVPGVKDEQKNETVDVLELPVKVGQAVPVLGR